MYHYTPEPVLLRSLYLAKKKPYNCNTGMSSEWALAKENFSDYQMLLMFLTYWEHTDLFSPTQLHEVPVNGILFPLQYFKKEII